MSDWWNSIPAFEKIFWYIGIPFTTFFILKTVLMILGFDDSFDFETETETDFDLSGSEDAEIEVEAEDGMDVSDFDSTAHENVMYEFASKFRVFSIRNIIVFFTIFSWSGIAFSRYGIHPWFTVSLAALTGAGASIIIGIMFFWMFKLQEDGTLDLQNAIGKTASVYLRVPPKKKGLGKIHVEVQGSLREFDAVTYGEEIPTGETVLVIDVIENNVLVVDIFE